MFLDSKRTKVNKNKNIITIDTVVKRLEGALLKLPLER